MDNNKNNIPDEIEDFIKITKTKLVKIFSLFFGFGLTFYKEIFSIVSENIDLITDFINNNITDIKQYNLKIYFSLILFLLFLNILKKNKK